MLPWFGSAYYGELLLQVCAVNNINPNEKYGKLTKKQRDIILYGTGEATYRLSPENNMSGKIYHAKYKGVINILTEKYFS